MGFAYREIRRLETEIQEPRILKLYFSQKLFYGGYFWFFPRGRNNAANKWEVNIGLGIMPVGNYRSPRQILEEYIQQEKYNLAEKELKQALELDPNYKGALKLMKKIQNKSDGRPGDLKQTRSVSYTHLTLPTN